MRATPLRLALAALVVAGPTFFCGNGVCRTMRMGKLVVLPGGIVPRHSQPAQLSALLTEP